MVFQNNNATWDTVTQHAKLVPFVVATSKMLQQMAWFKKTKKKTLKSQTSKCESNQVHSWLWLETYAAFLSSDLITRLFSCKVSGVGLSRSHILSRTPCGGKSLISCPVCMVSVNHGLHKCPVNSYWMQNIVGATQSTIYYVQQMDKWEEETFANVKKQKLQR